MGKKNTFLLLGIVIIIAAAICATLISMNLSEEKPDYECISNDEAAKMVASLSDSFSEIVWNEGNEENAYLTFTVNNGIMKNCVGTHNLTNENLLKILKYCGQDEKFVEEYELKLNRENRAVSKENWFSIYEKIVSTLDMGIEIKNAVIIGTPGNSENVEAWKAYTTEGVYLFHNLFLDGYIDNEISFFAKNSEIIAVKELVSTKVTYENAWLYRQGSNLVETYIDGINRTFYLDGLSENVEGVLCDITVDNQNVTQVAIKTDTVRGKVLSVTDTYVEIEGYGKIPFHEKYKLYRNYNGFAPISYKDILVGYELQDFIVADGMVCGAIVLYPFEVNSIRIMIRNTGFESIHHNEVVISCPGSYKIYHGNSLNQVENIKEGTSFVLNKDSQILGDERIRIVPDSSSDRIAIESITRSQGTPSYPGYLEIGADEDGLYIVNEVNLEEYLKLVVPSEMPAGYGVEASKVQAVCARSYAYNQLLNNDYMEYGAHIDDSTWYQVYNNTDEYPSSNEAVDATRGQVMTVNDEVITAYYYSTSCGHGSNVQIWGSLPESCSYITAHTINPDNTYIDLTNNDAFLKFIKSTKKEDFDSTFALYRWNTYLTLEEINKYYEEEAGVGKITSMEVTERLAGGSVNKALITGTKGTYEVTGEMNARKFFGDSEIEWTNNRDKTFTMSSLPSGFFALEPVYVKKKLTGYNIIGGGYGHGLGMSQNGAYEMTRRGYEYEEILKFFYEGIDIVEKY